MESAFYNMELKRFLELFGDRNQAVLGDDFCLVNVRNDNLLMEFESPIRLDAYVMMFCYKGRVKMNINMKYFDLKKDQLALLIPGNIGRVVEYDREEEISYVVVCVSRRFLSSLKLDLNRLFSDGVGFLWNPCIDMSADERDLSIRHLELCREILSSSIVNKRECLGSLVSSLFYLAEGLYSKQADVARESQVLRSSRADDIFSKFIRLLNEFHVRERTVGFYAEKLCLSPKYFSKLIRMATGRSAPDWIDSYVILEAKNYLKYSDISIKEVVARLHFSDQPTFTKFFKAHTGLTPAQFRKS